MHSCRRCTRESKCWNKKPILVDIISEISKGKAGKSYQQGAELLSAADMAPKQHLVAEKENCRQAETEEDQALRRTTAKCDRHSPHSEGNE